MKFLFSLFTLALPACIFSSRALAAGPGVEIINYYSGLLHALGVHDEHAVHEWMAVVGAVLSLGLLLIIGLLFKRAVEKSDSLVPSERFNLKTFVEVLLDFVHDLADDIIGKKASAPFFTLLASIFLFILISNLSGLVPGFPPATESLNTNLAIGLIVFIAYNWAGVREHGASYVKQFLGPVWWLAPLLLLIELVAHLARPLSLSLRLYGNIFGDHLVLSVFTGLTYLVLPAMLLFFGLLVASIQSFVFTLLSSIYISMAISHDH